MWKTIKVLFLVWSSHLQKSKQNCKRPGCEKLRTQMYGENNSIHIFNIKITINFLLNHLWWWIYVRFENCEIAIHSQSVVPQPSPPTKWRFDWEIGRIWDILASPCTKISHSSFNILLHLIYLGPLQNIVAIISTEGARRRPILEDLWPMITIHPTYSSEWTKQA